MHLKDETNSEYNSHYTRQYYSSEGCDRHT